MLLLISEDIIKKEIVSTKIQPERAFVITVATKKAYKSYLRKLRKMNSHSW